MRDIQVTYLAGSQIQDGNAWYGDAGGIAGVIGCQPCTRLVFSRYAMHGRGKQDYPLAVTLALLLSLLAANVMTFAWQFAQHLWASICPAT